MSLRTVFARVTLLCALAVPAVVIPKDADASVSIAVQFDALVKDADAVAVITPTEAHSIWEDGRIYTYTKVTVDQGVAGDMTPGADGWVRTMGGVVGKIGQLVDGEPTFVNGKQSLLFMRKFKTDGIFEVSARAQGQYPVVLHLTTKAKMLKASANAGAILPPKKLVVVEPPAPAGGQSADYASSKTTVDLVSKAPRLAQEVMHDKPLDDVSKEIASTWKKLHVPAK